MRPFVFFGAALAAVGSLFVFSSPARADDSPAPLDARGYSGGETRAGVLRLTFGAASIGGGAAAWTSGSPFVHTMAYPLFGGGALETVLGVSSLVRADRARSGALRVDMGDASYIAGEEQRLGKLRVQLTIRQAIEAAAFVGGGMVAYFDAGNESVRGFALGLSLEAGALLAGDAFAQSRAERFAMALRQVRLGFAPSRSGGGTFVVSGPMP